MLKSGVPKNVKLDEEQTSYLDTAQLDKQLLRTFYGTLERYFGKPDNLEQTN